ncbi:hypothetical protein [Vibrio fluminensis]|uniref:hypothetical protein n=1 Tax=Vibrio fluminensis TaxID=2783614 RepID=UPI0018890FBE|nr:hypothetical protein [Vibrio fluminensis]
MKIHNIGASLIALLFSFSSWADSEALSNAVLEQLSKQPTQQIIQSAFSQNPNHVLDVLTVLLSNERVDPILAITEAINAAPNELSQIVELARVAGISNEDITTAALLANADPTIVAEATAAGIALQPVSPPSAPAIGSNGGGGSGVVSPN